MRILWYTFLHFHFAAERELKNEFPSSQTIPPTANTHSSIHAAVYSAANCLLFIECFKHTASIYFYHLD